MRKLNIEYKDIYVDTTRKNKSGDASKRKYRATKKFKGPVLAMTAEKDCLFPAKNVLPQAVTAWKQSVCYLLKDRGHINDLSDSEKEMIIDFY